MNKKEFMYKTILKSLIFEQSEGEWSQEQIDKDVDHFYQVLEPFLIKLEFME